MALHIDALTIKFPAQSGYLTVSRLNAAAVGAAAGFDLEELDDLRLAITEAATWLLADEAIGGDVELLLASEDGRVSIDGTRRAAQLPKRSGGDLIEAILGATVDEFSFNEEVDGERRIRLVKVKAPANAG